MSNDKSAPKSKRCAMCNNPYTWYMQFVAAPEPSFYLPGSHIRGFPILKLCSEHKDFVKRERALKLAKGE